MSQSSFAGRFKVGTRIYTGFVIVLALLAILAWIGIHGIEEAETGTSKYASVSTNSLRVATVDGNVSEMRANVRMFMEFGHEKNLNKVRQLQESIDKDSREAIAVTLDPGRKASLEKMLSLFLEYKADFERAVTLRAKREKLVQEGMNPIGRKAREDLSQIIKSAMTDGDFEAAAMAGVVQEKLLLTRLDAVRFVESGDEESAKRARERMSEYLKEIEKLHERLHNPVRKALAEEGKVLAQRYLQAFNEAATAIQETDALINKRMVELGGAIAELSDATIESQRKFLAHTKAELDTDLKNTARINQILAALALVIGVLFAWLVARSITQPVVSMTGAMTGLAAGNLSVDIPALENRDEVGEMAKAVAVFKQNAIDKKRMDEAEAARLEAERKAAEAQRAREQAIGAEIAKLIDTVSHGDLASRLDLAGKDGFYLTMSEGINRLTDTVQGAIEDIARVVKALAEGDLNQRITKDYQGAFDGLKNDINATSNKLSEIVGQITNATEAIGQASAEVSAGSTDLAERTEQQASSLEETAASMEELGATVRTSAENARRADGMAGDARRAAEQGGGVAGEAIGAMKRIEEASRKITDIIGVIDEIAFQTNLLALNAAVEAARAGDAGKGFAVVAQEVRVLAQRSAQASKEIKTLILDSDSQVKNGVELVKKAGDSLSGIVNNVRQVAGLIGEIAAASGEQASALDEINSAVAAMDEMTQKNAALVEETTAAAQSMAGQSSDLRQLVGFFKLDQAAGGRSYAPAPARPAAAYAPAHHAPTHHAPARPAAKAAAKPTAHKPAPKPAAKPAPTTRGGGGVLQHAAGADDDEWKEF